MEACETLECSLHGLGSVLLSTAAAVGAPTEVGAACVAAPLTPSSIHSSLFNGMIRLIFFFS